VAEDESSNNGIRQIQTELSEKKEWPMLWNSPDSMRIRRPSDHALRPLRVLLSEDNPIDQISIRRLLEKQGMEVILAGDGRQALEIFEGGLFDLVLLDILMPEMDGFEVAMHIRELEKSSGDHVPVIALTAYSLNAVYDKCRSVGMNGYLSKPVRSSDLFALCAVLLPDSVKQQG
jgi:CheY-like chemotaxis protein